MNRFSITIVLMLIWPSIGQSQITTARFTLQDVIRIAQEQSPDAILAKHSFRAKYWRYRSFKAAYLPSLNFAGQIPNFNSFPDQDRDSQGNVYFIQSKYITNLAKLSLDQNIGLTGGTVSIESELQRIDDIDKKGSTRYISAPVRIGFTQPIFTYNQLKWDKKIEPLVYNQAKNSFIESLEQVSIRAITRFFDLANAQLNLNIAKINFNNSDTLYKIAQGRYNIGTIAQNDLLQMQLSRLNAEIDLNKAEINFEFEKSKLRSFLGYNERMNFDLIIPDSIPNLQLDFQKVMELAQKNSSTVIEREVRSLEAKRGVARAKGQTGRNIKLTASYGLSHDQADNLPAVYEDPFKNSQRLQIGFEIPIIDWGQARGRIKMAESQEELANIEISQDQIDFEQNIFLQVMQFNLQDDQVKISSTAEKIAQNRYDVTKQRFLIGKIDVLNLNDALKEKDNSKRNYINTLRNYWINFYTIRQLTLFNFIENQPLVQDYEVIVK